MRKIKEPVSSLTHLFGAVTAVPLTVLLIYRAVQYGTAWHVVSFAVFGMALLLLYTASAVYHMLPLKEKYSNILRRIDHMMIFILIAGTYTPICLIPLRGPWGFSILSVVWVIALLGIVLKALWLGAPRWLSTGLYIFMGWIVVIAFYPLAKAVSGATLACLVAGGVVYTAGGVLYGLKWPKFRSKSFGFHEIFHLLVLGGSAFHIVFMFMLM